jgi:hypothetical protein
LGHDAGQVCGAENWLAAVTALGIACRLLQLPSQAVACAAALQTACRWRYASTGVCCT